jgi:hypothetical protein
MDRIFLGKDVPTFREGTPGGRDRTEGVKHPVRTLPDLRVRDQRFQPAQ